MQRLSNLFRKRQGSSSLSTNGQAWLMVGNQLRSLSPVLRSGSLDYSNLYSQALAYNEGFNLSGDSLAQVYTMSLIAYACTEARAQMWASVPIVAITPDGQTVTSGNHPAVQFAKDAEDYLYIAEYANCVWGKNFYYRRRNVDGYTTDLQWLSPETTEPIIDGYGRITGYRVANRTVASSEILYYHTFNPLNPNDGISPYEVALQTLLTEKNMTQFASTFFANSARPDGILRYKGSLPLTDDQRQANQKSWAEQFKGARNAHRVAIMDGEWDFEPLTYSPKDLAMRELNELVQQQIIVAFGISPILIGLGQASDPLSAQSTYEAAFTTHIEYKAKPAVERYLALLNEEWLEEFDSVAGGLPLRLAVDVDAITAQSKANQERANTSTTLYTSGVLDLAEARDYIGKKPEEGTIKRLPSQVSIAYQDGAMTLGEYRAYLGLPPLPDQHKNSQFIYELDPRHTGQTASPFGGLGLGGFSLPAPSVAPIASEPTPLQLPASIEPPPFKPNAAVLTELRQWRDKQKARGGKANFKFNTMPEPYQRLLKAGLEAGWSYRHVGQVVEHAIRQDQLPAEPFGVSREEFDAYWRDLDSLAVDLGRAWLDYMQAVSPAFLHEAIPSEGQATDTDAARQRLIDTWAGTGEEFGDLTLILTAGMAKGNEVLNRQLGRATRDGVKIVWDYLAGDVVAFAQDYANGLIAELDLTTQRQIAEIMARYEQEGWSEEKLLEELQRVLYLGELPPDMISWRATLIADTESARAFNAGAEKRWQMSGVQKAIWQTVRDEHVCNICRPLHGETFDMAQGIYSQSLREYVRYVAHAGCRCFQQPDVSSLDLDALVAEIP